MLLYNVLLNIVLTPLFVQWPIAETGWARRPAREHAARLAAAPAGSGQSWPVQKVGLMSSNRSIGAARPLAALMLGASALAISLALSEPARAQDTCLQGNGGTQTSTCASLGTTTNETAIGTGSGVSVTGGTDSGFGA